MALLPIDTRLEVEKQIEDGLIVQKPRPYLGMSQLGEKCSRKLWYDFRICSEIKIKPRLKRLFDRGHREEYVFQRDLRKMPGNASFHGRRLKSLKRLFLAPKRRV